MDPRLLPDTSLWQATCIGMSISYDDLCIVDSQTRYSSSDMSFPATSAPASVISFNNDLPGSHPSTSSTLSDIDHPLTLDSFIPILSHLSGLYLDQNLVYIRGSITNADWACLCDYTQRVSKFVVTDVNKDSEAQISPSTFLRLARLQRTLLPSLSDLVIVDADASIACLELLLTPSLKSLEASCIPDAQQSTFFSFLTAIEQEAPHLQTLILGPGRFLSGSIQTISKFNNLSHLELKNEDSEIPFAFFDNIGSLPKLETLILDARYVSSPIFKNQSNSTEEHTTLTSTSGAFNQLAKLHVVGWLPFLEDLIPRITSTKLEDVSVTFIRLSDDELKVSLEKEAEREKAEEKRREQAEERRRKEEKSWREETAPQISSLPQPSSPLPASSSLFPPSSPGPCFSTIFPQPPSPIGLEETIAKLGSVDWGSGKTGTKGTKGKKGINEKRERRREAERRQEEEKRMQEAQELRERLLKEELERLAHVSFNVYTGSFTELLQMLCHRGTASLKTVSICQLGKSFQPLFKLPTLPEEMFRRLLRLPAIESLELNGWMLDSVENVIETAELIPNLNSLLLPLDETNSGISLFTLRRVAEICPKLESFQCRIDRLSLIPEYTIPTTNALSHGLRTLSIGSSSPLPNAKQLYLIARHLYLLFPNLETINTSKEHNAEQWIVIDELVKMCQTARMIDMNRPSAPITQLT